LWEYALNKNLVVIGMVETFVNIDVLPAEIYMNGYKSYRNDRCNFEAGKNGEVILYGKRDIMSYESSDFNQFDSESVWCKIKIGQSEEITIRV
jgi:hypothetical protein